MCLSTGLRSAAAVSQSRRRCICGALAARTGTGTPQLPGVLCSGLTFTLIRTVVRIRTRAATNRKTVPAMADLKRCSVAWQNWPGSPGVSQFFLDDTGGQAQVDAIRTFFNAAAPFIPSGLTINVPNSRDTVDQYSGKLTGVWP